MALIVKSIFFPFVFLNAPRQRILLKAEPVDFALPTLQKYINAMRGHERRYLIHRLILDIPVDGVVLYARY